MIELTLLVLVLTGKYAYSKHRRNQIKKHSCPSRVDRAIRALQVR